MSLSVSYKNREIAALSGEAALTLQTAGKYCEGDISLALREPAPSGGIYTPLEPDYAGMSYCSLKNDGETMERTQTRNNYLNFFPVEGGHAYIFLYGATYGNVNRASYFAGRTIADFTEAIENAGGGDLYSDGRWFGVPKKKNTEDSTGSMPYRIWFFAEDDGIVAYQTGNSEYYPAGRIYGIDIGRTQSRSFQLTITGGLRGESVLTYVGAHEIRLIFGSQNGEERNIADLPYFILTPYTASPAFDGDLYVYWEDYPTPVTVSFSAQIPEGYTPLRLEVYQRSGSFTGDVWSSFRLTSGTETLLDLSGLTVNDWAGAKNWTVFPIGGAAET